MHPITEALLAVLAAEEGDLAAGQAHLATAQRYVRTAARRDRQIVEIAALVVAGHRERAVGLAMEHTVEFPDDAGLLARVSTANRP
jgi:hypothetical protein